MLYASRICSIFPLWMESKAMVKLTNSNVTCRFFARTPSRILRMVNICEVVDLFLWKPFWFFLRLLLILGSMQFRSRAKYFLTSETFYKYQWMKKKNLITIFVQYIPKTPIMNCNIVIVKLQWIFLIFIFYDLKSIPANKFVAKCTTSKGLNKKYSIFHSFFFF